MIFFKNNPNLKKNFFFGGGGGWGEGARVSEFFYFKSKLTFFYGVRWQLAGGGRGLELVIFLQRIPIKKKKGEWTKVSAFF